MTNLIENNSGNGPQTVVPAEIAKGFNWGAFLLTWIWGLGNKSYITLLTLVTGFVPVLGPLVSIGLAIWFGKKGNEWAWQNKKWESVEHFRKVQKTWTKVAIIVYISSIVLGVTIGVALFSAGNAIK